jgi:hypothetical protein
LGSCAIFTYFILKQDENGMLTNATLISPTAFLRISRHHSPFIFIVDLSTIVCSCGKNDSYNCLIRQPQK